MKMQFIGLGSLLIALFLASCSGDLAPIAKAHPDLRQVLKALEDTGVVYRKCDECRLPGREEGVLVGYTPRYPPKGRYDKRVIELGDFNYDALSVLASKDQEFSSDQLYFLYLTEKQKILFESFYPYYSNLIRHGKRVPRVDFVGNIVVLRICAFDSDIFESFLSPLPSKGL